MFRRQWTLILALFLCTMMLLNIRWLVKMTGKGPMIDSSRHWLQDSQKMSRLNESTLRCSAENLGLFSLFRNVSRKLRVGQKERCFQECFREHQYAAVLRNQFCHCTSILENLIINEKTNAADSMDLAANRSMDSQVRIFKKTAGCFTEFSETTLQEAKIGCIPLPAELGGSMKSWKLESMTAKQCILQCEKHQYVTAMPVRKFQACICSDLQSMFETPERMYASTGACDKDVNNNLYEIYRTFSLDQHCGQKAFLQPKEKNVTLLNSLPGSGNTWVRHLIEKATGFYTGTVYIDRGLFNDGMLGNLPSLSRRTIVVKDHFLDLKISDEYSFAITIVRNVRDSIISEFTRQKTRSHTGTINPNLLASKAFKDFAQDIPKKWVVIQRLVFEHVPSVLVLYYEDLVADPLSQLRKILKFLPDLGIPEDDLENKLLCLNLDISGRFKRPRKHIKIDPYDEEMKKNINDSVVEMDDLMRKYHQPAIPESYYNK